MARIAEHGWLKWPLRGLFVLAATEGTLALGVPLLERMGGVGRGEAEDDAIVCSGDSNTFGIGAPSGRSYPDQLEELLRKSGVDLHVVNLGVPGAKSSQAVDRLEELAERARPRCIVLLSGLNDLAHRDQIFTSPFAASRSWGERACGWLRRHLRTVRVAETAWHLLQGDVARAEFGGRAESPVDPSMVPPMERPAAYAQARALGGQALFDWVSYYWRTSHGMEARVAWNDFVATESFSQVAPRLVLPREHYEWELAMLCGEDPGPLRASGLEDFAGTFAQHTEGVHLLAEGKPDAARSVFDGMLKTTSDWHFKAFLDVHRGWCSLAERSFAAAREELEAAAVEIESMTAITDDQSPVGPWALVGLFHALGGAGVAHLLAGPASRLTELMERHATTWSFLEQYWAAPDGKEWMGAALLIDAMKSGSWSNVVGTRRRVEDMVGTECRTRVLRWLFEHPRAPFESLQKDLELDAPRIAWIGPGRKFFWLPPARKLDRFTTPAFDRLAQLASKRGIPVLVLTYLNPRELAANDRMRRMAQREGWDLIDLHELHTPAELDADECERYFSKDRGHPNEAGYGLVAKAVFDKLKTLGLAR